MPQKRGSSWRSYINVGSRYPCNLCGKSYRHVQSLYNHSRFECGKDPQYACPGCPYKAKRKSTLRDHVKRIHPLLENDALNPLAAEAFPVKTEQEGHDANTVWLIDPNSFNAVQEETNCTNEVPQFCGTVARERKPFSCSQCGRSYGKKNTLQRHLTYECGKEPQFPCPFCPQKCKRKSDRMIHIKRLHKDKVGLVTDR
ncbi:hypothetical protein ILUMI_02646 [Ignelater luminosus]|uniref:C2H2-type domain-containing protein n=1 Tax=Ignelater luminosus TaxID=2038154 RepID=A0A8K0DNC8_IGNLU|nr:hypothetical protein ILUMI_02646 [Ignelater luminosus]